MTDPLDTEEGRALYEAVRDAENEWHRQGVDRPGRLTTMLRALLAATNEHGESIVVLRSEAALTAEQIMERYDAQLREVSE